MTAKIWTAQQAEKLYDLKTGYTVPLQVIEEVRRLVQLLNDHYGFNRDVDNEDGGFVALLLPEDESVDIGSLHLKLLEEFHLCIDTEEMETLLCKSGKWEWHSDLYMVTNEYGITVIYPKRRGW